MPFNFDDDTKAFEGGQGNWFGFGVHEVKIGTVTEGTTDSGTDYIEFEVFGENEETDTARVWLTEKSAKYSFDRLRRIYVHCAPEAKKDKARDEFDAAADSTAVVALFQKCLGKQIWFTKYPDPTRKYIAADGSEKSSINKTVEGYQPKLREDLLPKDQQATLPVDKVEDMPLGGKDVTGKVDIPDDWDK